MDKLGIIGLAVLVVVGLFKFIFSGNSKDADDAAQAMADVASQIRRRFTAMKVKYAKEKRDDTDDSSLDEWINDSLRPRTKPKRPNETKPKGGK